MNFGPLDRPKKQVVIDLVATLSRLLTRKGNRVGAILYNHQIYRTISPKGGRIQVLRLIQELLNETKAPAKTTTDLSVLVNAGLNMIKKHTLVFVISDFISTSSWAKPLSLLGRKNELIGIRLWDSREVELPDIGMIFVEDAETGEQLRVDTSNPEFRRRFFEAAERRETELKQNLKKAGVDLFAISTQEDLVHAILRIAAMRKKRRV